MSQFPAMPMFWDTYIADTTHLTTEEHGCYLLLLAAMWRRNGFVPNDDRDIARIVGLSTAKWTRIKRRLEPLLIITENDITQKKLQKVWENCAEKVQKNRENGAKGGRPKSNKNNNITKANGYEINNPKKSNHNHNHNQEDIDKESISNIRRFSEDFEVWWKDEYPERKGTHSKAKARQKYIRFRKAGISREQISRVTDAYFHELQETGRLGTEFVQHATTFLNAELWEND